MLLEFRVKNFKSIRDEQVLSMIANKDKSHEESHVANLGNGLRVLKSAVIYGANASGKSNLIDALAFMIAIVLRSGRGMDLPANASPVFRLDSVSDQRPSEFEVTYLESGIRFQYGFSLKDRRIYEEWLLVYHNDKPQQWFRRVVDPDVEKEVYKFGSHLKGQKKIWQSSTRANALFLSTAVSLNSEQLTPVFQWFARRVHVVHPSHSSNIVGMNLELLKNNDYKHQILLFLLAADLGISDIVVKTEKRITRSFTHSLDNNSPTEQLAEVEFTKPLFVHKRDDDMQELFELGDESNGTKSLFGYAFRLLVAMEEGQIIVIDELESSLHPLLVRFIISLFNTSKNKKGAQLIFSTHDAGLLDTEIFRRDQIWFVEKDASQATILYPLTDFSPRKKEALESGYLSGRYGAIPFLSDFDIDGFVGDGA